MCPNSQHSLEGRAIGDECLAPETSSQELLHVPRQVCRRGTSIDPFQSSIIEMDYQTNLLLQHYIFVVFPPTWQRVACVRSLQPPPLILCTWDPDKATTLGFQNFHSDASLPGWIWDFASYQVSDYQYGPIYHH